MAVVVQTVAATGSDTTRQRTRRPCCSKDMVRWTKSQVTGPNVPSHWAPRTTSKPANGMTKRSVMKGAP